MRRLFLSLLTVAAAGSAVPAHADSTITERVPAGGSLRSSTDAAPTPANPVIVTVTNTAAPQPGAPPEFDGSAAITIALKSRAETKPGGNPEGPSGYEFMGPNVNITSPDPANISVVFEVEGSLRLPDFLTAKSQFTYNTTGTGRTPLTGFNYMALPYDAEAPFGAGDYRLTVNRSSFGTYDLLQEGFYALVYANEDSFPDALKKGVGVYLKTNFKVEAEWTVKVSNAVAKRLKLKSTTIGMKTFAKPGGGDRRVPLTSAARKALKKYKRVAVTLYVEATGPNGEVISRKKALTLKTPDSELG